MEDRRETDKIQHVDDEKNHREALSLTTATATPGVRSAEWGPVSAVRSQNSESGTIKSPQPYLNVLS